MFEPISRKKKVLVVDDEPLVCEAIGMMLDFDGFVVVAARNGEEALAMFDRDVFDLVVTDYTMPGMKGDELAREIKARVPGQPIIMITAHADLLRTSAIPLTGVDQVVSKPFQFEDIRQAIQRVSLR